MAEVEERLGNVETRLGAVETRLGAVEKGVEELREEVGGLRGEVSGLRGEVGGLRGEVGGLRGEVGGLRGEVGELRGRTDSLADDVQKLRVLGEENQRQWQFVIEQHGRRFDAIDKALEPLAKMSQFMQMVTDDHEVRIRVLEQHTGLKPS